MKKTIITIIILLITQAELISQTCTPNPAAQNCETGKGISTNPNNPVNPECSNMVNNFDWRMKHLPGSSTVLERFWVYYDDDQNPTWIQNPFNGPMLASHEDLIGNHTSNYQPEDGWELLKVAFGSMGNIGLAEDVQPGPNTVSNERPKLPYMIMYNKYTGTMRFFGSLLEPDNTYETVRIELRIPKQSPPPKDPNQPYSNVYDPDLKATNLLSIQGESVQPLDQETDESSIAVFVKYTNNPKAFFWFDLPVAYDPCVCNNKVQLDVSFSFVQTADIDITGSLTGSIKTEKKGDEDYGKMLFSKILAAGVSTALAIKTGGAIINVQAYADLVKVIKNNPNSKLSQQQKDNLDQLGNYLDCGAKFSRVMQKSWPDLNDTKEIKQHKGANDILEGGITFMSSLANGCNKTDNAATLITGAINAKGKFTLTDDIVGTRIALALPGSNWTGKQMKSAAYKPSTTWIPAYPTYNERLGTFALLETPKIKVYYKHMGIEDDALIGPFEKSFYRIDFEGPIKYTLNPKLNVNLEKTEIQVRYVIKQRMYLGPNHSSFNDLWIGGFRWNDISILARNIINYTDISTPYSVVTPFVPLEYHDGLESMILPQLVFKGPCNISPCQRFFEGSTELNYSDSIFIQFKITMESNDIGKDGQANSAVYFLTYPVEVSEEIEVQENLLPPLSLNATPEQWYWWSWENQRRKHLAASTFTSQKPALNGGNASFNREYYFNDDRVLFYDGFVEINAKLSTAAGKKVKIYSTLGFELLPGAEIDPSIELIVGYPFESNPIPPQTYQQVSSFCSDNTKYKAQEFSAAAIAEEKATYEEREKVRILSKMEEDRSFKFGLKPNPTSGMSTVFWDGDEMPNQLTLIDGTGQLLFETPLSGDGRSYDLDMSEYSHGVYFIIITAPSGKKGQQKLIKL